jgi:anti-sigma factor RsiW
MSDWLDLELSHHLAPIAAPEALWDRIGGVAGTAGNGAFPPALVRPGRLSRITAWTIAAILALTAATGVLRLVAQRQKPILDLQHLAIEQLRNPEPLAMHSGDPRAVSAWMRQAGIDVTIPALSNDTVHLVGARVFQKRGARIGAVVYRVGSDTATLLVAKSGLAPGTAHGQLSCKTRSQSYTVACSNPDRPEAACLLCHASL